jgi:transposase
MIVLKLLPNEDKILKSIDGIKNTEDIASELGISRQTVFSALRRLHKWGAASRKPVKGRNIYFNSGLEYEVVKKRERELPPLVLDDNDILIRDAMQFKPSRTQYLYLKKNKNELSRSEMTKYLGITRLELNFALIKI